MQVCKKEAGFMGKMIWSVAKPYVISWYVRLSYDILIKPYYVQKN